MTHKLPICVEFINNDQTRPAIRSLELAKHFSKNHKEILRDIEKLSKKLPVDFGERNFALSSYTSDQNKILPCYLLSRDAFTLLVMGWTGKEALNWKLRYIEVFNSLEQAVHEQAIANSSVAKGYLKLAKSLSTQRKVEIKKVAHYFNLGLKRSEISRLLGCSPDKIAKLLKDHQLLSEVL